MISEISKNVVDEVPLVDVWTTERSKVK